MKFHLSTLLLAILVAALCIGWYLNSTELERDDFAGSWESTSEGFFTTNHSPFTKLEIHHDGSFVHRNITRPEIFGFRGTYTLERFGMITFTVTGYEYQNAFRQQLYEIQKLHEPKYAATLTPPNYKKPIEASITCHGSLNAEGILKLEKRAVNNPGKHPDKELPGWGSFKKSSTLGAE
jgi:hypothetical protein